MTTSIQSVLIVTTFESSKDDTSTTLLAVGIAIFGVLVFASVVAAVFLLKKRRREKALKQQLQQLEEVTTENHTPEAKTIYDDLPVTSRAKTQYDNFSDLATETKSEYANSPHTTQRDYVNVPKEIMN